MVAPPLVFIPSVSTQVILVILSEGPERPTEGTIGAAAVGLPVDVAREAEVMIGGAVLQLNKGMVMADGTTDVAGAMLTAAGASTELTMLVRRRAEVQKPQLH